MKRIIVIALLTMIILSLILTAYGDETEVAYVVNADYVISLPATTTYISKEKGADLTVSFSECHTEGAKIYISSNNFNSGWRLTSGNEYIPYAISLNGRQLTYGDSFDVSKYEGTTLHLWLNNPATLSKISTGTYTDRLIFTITSPD